MKASVAVVILNWNGKNHLETYLPSVVKYSNHATIYLADNASTDDSINYVKSNFRSIKIIQNSENGGFAKGYNDCLMQLTEEYFVLLNSDVEVTENWLLPVIEQMEQDQKIVIAQPKIKSFMNKKEFEYAGAAGGFIDFLGYPFCQGRIFDTLEKDQGQYDVNREVFWATGACMFVKSKIFKDLGGFDERYFAHMEEIDLCWRAKNRGFKIYYVAQSEVYHLGGGTMKNTNPRKTFLNFRNSLMTLRKNDNSSYTSLKILFRLMLDGLAFFKLFIDSGPQHAMAILKAHQSFYKMKNVQAIVDQPNLYGVYKRSIVFDYYLFGKKKFSQLKKGFS